MAHYAFLDRYNVVTDVIVGCDESQEIDYEKHYEKFRGQRCKRTSFNTHGGVHSLGGEPFRKNYAGKGYMYSDMRDAFVPPRPFMSWNLNEDTCLWEPPVPMPEGDYQWDEVTQTWAEQ